MIEHYENFALFFPWLQIGIYTFKALTEQSDNTIFETRSSEASIKLYERSEFIVAFAFWILDSINKKTAPKRAKRVQNVTSEASAIGLFYPPPPVLLIFLNAFKCF